MTDYMRCGDFMGHADEESQFMGFYPMSENACDGYGMHSPIEMPCSPTSEGSDWSMSSATTQCMSQPSSPNPEELKKPYKSSLKRQGCSSRPKMNVRWTIDTIFDTRPLVKRRRPSPSSDENDIDEQDSELKAPIPTKKAKIAELENHAAAATALHFLPSLSVASSAPSSFTPIFPEASRTVIPSFNFSSFVSRGSAISAPTMASPSAAAPASLDAGKPRFQAFKLAAPKTLSHSNLLVAAVNKI